VELPDLELRCTPESQVGDAHTHRHIWAARTSEADRPECRLWAVLVPPESDEGR
jgi:hypothetical protein